MNTNFSHGFSETKMQKHLSNVIVSYKKNVQNNLFGSSNGHVLVKFRDYLLEASAS